MQLGLHRGRSLFEGIFLAQKDLVPGIDGPWNEDFIEIDRSRLAGSRLSRQGHILSKAPRWHNRV